MTGGIVNESVVGQEASGVDISGATSDKVDN